MQASTYTGRRTSRRTSGMNVNAAGGNASNGTGGDAYGGYADIYAYDGGTLNGGALTVTANAAAGTGASNGYAIGGSISLSSDDYESELPTAIAFDTITLTANTIGSRLRGLRLWRRHHRRSLRGSITADSLVATANGSTDGGYIDFETWTDYSESPGQLQFGTVNATANGGDTGGYISFSASGGSITADSIVATANGGIDGGFIGFPGKRRLLRRIAGPAGSSAASTQLPTAASSAATSTPSPIPAARSILATHELRANGGSSGYVYLLAGCCGDGRRRLRCANQSAPLPAGGGIAASRSDARDERRHPPGLSSGADISVAGTFEADAGNTISISTTAPVARSARTSSISTPRASTRMRA